VSRLLNLLNDIADPNNSIVNSDPEGCTEYLYNVRNEFDPFTWIKKYDRPIEHGKHIDINTVRKTNTHDLQEYMEAPDTAWYFFARVLGIKVSTADYDAGVAKHKETSMYSQYDVIKAALNDVKQSSGTDFSNRAEAIKALVKAVEAAKSTLDALQD
jgi:hypothetical protein